MRHCVVLDSCFLVATIDAGDEFNKDAIYLLRKLLHKKCNVKIIIPPIALYEVLAVLVRKGFSHKKAEGAILRLLHLDKTIALSISENTALKHSRSLLAAGTPATALRTADFMIAGIGLDFEAQILTFDRRLLARVKPIYSKIYYCSSSGGHIDETGDFLADLQNLSSK
jgi:predicted nucleic acid-binding protein